MISKRKTNIAYHALLDVETQDEDCWSTNTATTITNSIEIPLQSPALSRCKTTYAPENQNWFARFFHVKPAVRAIALNVAKKKGRKEVYKILRGWKKYGLENVHLDKTENVIFGRVVEGNCMFMSFLSSYVVVGYS